MSDVEVTGPTTTRDGLVVTVRVPLAREGFVATLRFVGRLSDRVVDLRRIDIRAPRGENVTDLVLRSIPLEDCRKRAALAYLDSGHSSLFDSARAAPRSGRAPDLDRYHDLAQAYFRAAARGRTGIYERLREEDPQFRELSDHTLQDMVGVARLRHGFISAHPERTLTDTWREYDAMRQREI